MSEAPVGSGDGPDLELGRRRLGEERARLEAVRAAVPSPSVGGDDDSGSGHELSSVDQHPADMGTETQYQEQNLSTIEAIDGELADVDAALRRIDDGTYGRCAACGRTIPTERLDALPATPWCIDDAYLAESEAAAGDRTTAPEERD